ncbi:MAG: hypothetical protein ACREIF_08855 [Chthoniobacterales bacterium]
MNCADAQRDVGDVARKNQNDRDNKKEKRLAQQALPARLLRNLKARPLLRI